VIARDSAPLITEVIFSAISAIVSVLMMIVMYASRNLP